MGGRRSVVTAVAALALAVTACSGGDEPEPEPTSTSPTATEAPSPTPTPMPTTEAAVDPTVVPDEITVEYLDAVMDEFGTMRANVYARLAANGGDPNDPEVLQPYAAFTNLADAKQDLEGFIRAWGVEGIADEPTAPRASVQRIVDQQEQCILFSLEHDPTTLLADHVEYEPANEYFAALRPTEPNTLNPLPWKLSLPPTFYGEGQTPPAACADLGN